MKFWLLLFGYTLLVYFAYQSSLDAEFVYDDNRQIEANHLIQNPQLYRQALMSDVWSFKADGQTAVSNYWRPTFVAWMMINYQLFGLDSHAWHVINLLLHLLVVVMLFFLLRSWSIGSTQALTVAALFALHPVHVESVAWVAGSPDLLFSFFALSALWCWQMFMGIEHRKFKHWLLAVSAMLLYALALGAKEVAILLPPLFIMLAYWQGRISTHLYPPCSANSNTAIEQGTRLKLVAVSLLFVVLAVVYFIVRYQILGYVSKPQSANLPFSHFIYSLPQVIWFYWQQLFLPWSGAANFPPRVLAEFSVAQFLLPLLGSLLLLTAALFLSRKSRFQTLGLLILCLPLLPALNLFAFHHEQLVHHRYLYLPVLGVLMLLLPVWRILINRQQAVMAWLLLSVLLLVFTFQSWRFSQIWHSNKSLWLHTTQIDPDSAFNWQQLANVYLEANQLPEATAAFEQSLGIQVTPRSLYGLAKTQHLATQHDDALETLQQTIAQHSSTVDLYLAYQIYELYAVVLTANHQLGAAENHLRTAINKLPQYQVLLIDKLAVVLYLQNKKSAALQLLKEAEQGAIESTHMAAKLVLFRLGMLYGESNQIAAAKEAFTNYLLQTQTNSDPSFTAYNKAAQNYLNSH